MSKEAERIEALKAEIAATKRAREAARIRNVALAEAVTKGLPAELVDLALADDEAATLERLGTLAKAVEAAAEAKVQQVFKDHGRRPQLVPAPMRQEIRHLTPDQLNREWPRIQAALRRGEETFYKQK